MQDNPQYPMKSRQLFGVAGVVSLGLSVYVFWQYSQGQFLGSTVSWAFYPWYTGMVSGLGGLEFLCYALIGNGLPYFHDKDDAGICLLFLVLLLVSGLLGFWMFSRMGQGISVGWHLRLNPWLQFALGLACTVFALLCIVSPVIVYYRKRKELAA